MNKSESGGVRLSADAVVKPVMVRATVDGPREVWGYCGASLHLWRQEENGDWWCSVCIHGPLKVAW